MTTSSRDLEIPGAVLKYDVHSGISSNERTLVLAGWPMGASGFSALVPQLTDRMVITYDPRGVDRSVRTDDSLESNPDLNADDLHRLIESLGGGAVDLFATSGGAINSLALVSRHPKDVRVLVAHEPPLASALPDRVAVVDAMTDIKQTYESRGFGLAMAKFIALATHTGALPSDYGDRPAPEPQMFGLPTVDDGSRGDVMLGNMIGDYQLDFEVLRSAPTRIVVAAGAASEGEIANRGAHAVAERLGLHPVTFPGGHGGFMDQDFGRAGHAAEFAAVLIEILSAGT